MKFYLKQGSKKVSIQYHDSDISKYLIKEPGRSVVKITSKDKFMITKCGSVEWLCKEINTTMLRYQKSGIPEDNLYFPLVKYCHSKDIQEVNIEVLFTSENGYDVLKKELNELIENFGAKDCLNKSNIPYIPKTIHAKKGSNWLTQNQYLNFMKLLKGYEY